MNKMLTEYGTKDKRREIQLPKLRPHGNKARQTTMPAHRLTGRGVPTIYMSAKGQTHPAKSRASEHSRPALVTILPPRRLEKQLGQFSP